MACRSVRDYIEMRTGRGADEAIAEGAGFYELEGGALSAADYQQERRCVYYTGHVQGVGFRYTAQRVARGYRVSGYVRNLDDGRVELVIEGPVADLDACLEEIASRMGHCIRRADCQAGGATGEFVDFRIRF